MMNMPHSKGADKSSSNRKSGGDTEVVQDPDNVPYPAYLETDFLFVLTKGLHCLLLGFNKDKQKTELISKGYLRDRNSIELDPPYSMFLACDGKAIAMMIHTNLLKVIPIVRNSKTKIVLSQAFNVRIRHPEVNLIIPLSQHDSSL